jgi:hypothetical protein
LRPYGTPRRSNIQQLSGGERRERQGCRLASRKAFGLGANDPLHGMKFGIGAGPVDGTGIEDGAARLEEPSLRPGRLDDTNGL